MANMNHFICPTCGHDFFATCAYATCDACGCFFYASQSRTSRPPQPNVTVTRPLTVRTYTTYGAYEEPI